METILAELSKLFSQADESAVKRMIAAVNCHERIFVHAAGRSGLMLRAFAMRLAQMGKTVFVVGETVTPAIGTGDLLVTASASGSTAGVCRNAQIAKEAGADLFVISAKEQSVLAEIHPVDILLPAATKDSAAGSAQVMGSLFEQALLILCDGVIAAIPYNPEQMRSRHANLE